MPGILILAAGLGRRYKAAGGQGEKLLAPCPPHDNQPLIAVVITQALASGLPVHVVTRPESVGIQALANRYQLPVTLITSHVMGESIAAGVRSTGDWDGWLIQPGDMPEITSADYQAVAQALKHHHQARPMWQNLPGHPVGFGTRWGQALMELNADRGARSLIGSDVVILPGHPGVIADRDLPPA